MNEFEDWKDKSRKSLYETIFGKVNFSGETQEIFISVKNALRSVGIYIKAKELGLLEEDQWQHKENHPELIEKIKEFIWDESR